MAQVDVLRPDDSWQGTVIEWTAVPSGTIHGVLSDDSDSTYADHPSGNRHLGIIYDTHTLPAGHGRHRVRQGLRLSGNGYIDSWLSETSGTDTSGAGAWLTVGRFEADDPNTPQTIYGQWISSLVNFFFDPTYDFRSRWGP